LGHTVINENDTILIDRPRLHFTGNVSVKDDATNGETDVEILGTEDHVYDTYAEAIADIDDIGEGESVYVKEGSSDDLKDRVENIESSLSGKQDKTDNGIKTTAKTVVGAINELLNNLTSKQNKEDSTLTTTAKTIVGAIDEVNDKAEDNADAISRINSDLTDIKTGNVTWNTTNKTSGTAILTKIGRICQLTLDQVSYSSLTHGTTIFTVPDEFKPANRAWIPIVQVSDTLSPTSDWTTFPVALETNGNAIIYSTSGSARARLASAKATITYISAS